MFPIVFAGTPEVAVPSLRALHDNDQITVVGVITRADAPQGRGRKMVASPVKQAAQALGIPVFDTEPTHPGFLEELAASGAKAAAVVAYGRILKPDVLDALEQGWYNLHFSLLPQWRGAAPVQRAIWSGDEITGASVFRITPGLDDGPILAQSTRAIGVHETAGELLEALAHDGSGLLVSALRAVADGSIRPVDQEQGVYDVAHKITVEQARIRFDVPAFAVDRHIRACTPTPGAWCEIHPDGLLTTNEDCNQPASPLRDPIRVIITKAQIADVTDPSIPSALQTGVVTVTKRHVLVGTASEPLELLTVKPQGKKEMAATDWARGARLSDHAIAR